MTDKNVLPPITEAVAGFITGTEYKDLPGDVVELGKKHILDGLGLAIAGSSVESGKIVQAHLGGLGCSGSSLVIGTAMRTAPRFAAFANGVAIHAEDYDDTQLAVAKDRVYGLLTHPTAPALPAALAVAEQMDADGPALMLAYHLGVEVECKIAEAINPRHYQEGFHSTATCGTFAAAAGVAKLMGQSKEQVRQSLSIAGSQSAGLRENFGTMTKPFHAGRSSESGVVAAEFAANGWTATDIILEAPRGFFRAAGGGFDETAIQNKLGHPWTFSEPGISIKPHPSGSLTHPGMTKMMELILEHDIRPEQVASVKVGTNQNMPNALIHHRPNDELQAKFSMEFCMAILLLERRGGLNEFTVDAVHRADVKAMIEKVDFGVHPEAEAAGYDKMTTIIDITLVDGREITGRSDFGRGSPAFPMDYMAVADKFRECAEFARFPTKQAEAIVKQVTNLDGLGHVRELTDLLVR
ncbi:MAG: MmgE/PrpD family protein [Rhodospirillales bacterium]|jgi:2-methylcitrate dehydratase PrpD|nr:MmgE/PrpD family protein [Rhodospirillales bacterium]MBT4006072.1 MmgE/PrpD family protein [Rhodospirillales bacterium]MBT5075762.1 MmgE/PrpD family protein [Rhodospirillales bacterium]MBT5112815.1 MmgE/PrpD family protein [Rhodospirillales bacterium]MBT5673585.1 MmgE/PrpD family protein [Rhodospirillales bacterium]